MPIAMTTTVLGRIMLAISLALSPLSDFPLQNTALGILGSNLAFLPLTLVLGISILEFAGRLRWSKRGFMVFLWILIITILGVLLYTQDGFYIRGENIFLKGAKLFVLVLLFFTPILFSRWLEIRYIKIASIVAFALMLLGVLLVDVLGNEMLLHGNPNVQMRPRGFALESSHLSITAISLSVILVLVFRTNFMRTLILLSAVLIVAFSDSKGGIATLLLSGVLTFLLATLAFMRHRSINFYTVARVFVLIFALGAAGLIAYNRALTAFQADVSLYTSSATRATMAMSALSCGFPLGVGFVAYLPCLIDNLEPAVNKVSNFLPNTGEAYGYILKEDDKEISTKSTLFDGFVLLGVPFLIFFLLSFLKMIWAPLVREDFLVSWLIGAIFLGMMFYVGHWSLYAISFSLGVAKKLFLSGGKP